MNKGILFSSFAMPVRGELNLFISIYELLKELELSEDEIRQIEEKYQHVKSIQALRDDEIYYKFFDDNNPKKELNDLKDMVSNVQMRCKQLMLDKFKDRYLKSNYIIHFWFSKALEKTNLEKLVIIVKEFSKDCFKNDGISNPQLFLSSERNYFIIDIVLDLEKLQKQAQIFRKFFEEFGISVQISEMRSDSINDLKIEFADLKPVESHIVHSEFFDFERLRNL